MRMRNYWTEMYGTQSQDFIEGVLAGVEAYAIWKDNKQYVGIDRIPLEDVIQEIKEGLGYKETIR